MDNLLPVAPVVKLQPAPPYIKVGRGFFVMVHVG